MNYFIFGGAGFVGTHLTKLLKEIHPESMIYNLDIVEPVTQMFTIKGYNAVLKASQRFGVRRSATSSALRSRDLPLPGESSC